MRIAVGEHATYRQVSDQTGANPETVRRYMQGQAPSVEFVAALCRVFGISADWLLTGRGPMKVADLKGHVLGESSAGELFTAVADNLERLLARVDRLERYVQTLETQVRGLESADGTESGHGHDAEQPPADPPSIRLRQLREALAQRPARMLVELLRPLGPELARRWLAALTLVPEAERPGVVRAIEAHIASIYDRPAGEVRVVEPPVQREGFVEQVEVTYARAAAERRSRGRDARA